MGCAEAHRKLVAPRGSQEVCSGYVYGGLLLSIWGCLGGSHISMGISGLVGLGCALRTAGIIYLEKGKRNFHQVSCFSENIPPLLGLGGLQTMGFGHCTPSSE